MHYKIPFADPYITRDDVNAVAKAVKEKMFSQGKYVQAFEAQFARYIGTKYAVAVSSGTAALHVSLATISVRSGDEVIVPSFSFVATANCVLYQGAKPVFADIDPLTYDIEPEQIKKKITNKTKAIIPVHYGGQPADMDSIREIAEKHHICVVEDAAEALGALYKGKKAGCLGDLNCFSFYPNKSVTTAEGGIITTNNEELALRMRMIRSHGQDKRYHHVMLGYNYKMTDIQAALGLVQLNRLDWIVEKKVERANYYSEQIDKMCGNKIKIPYVAPYATHAYMFYAIRFQNRKIRDKAILELEAKQVETRVAFPPIHLQPLYVDLYGYVKGHLAVTEKVFDTILCIPIYPHIAKEDQDYALSVLKEVFK